MTEKTTLKARTAAAFALGRGRRLTVRNTHGSQVVDTWALTGEDRPHALSMPHTRVINGKITVNAGDTLHDDLRRPMLQIVRDTSPGVHDTLIPACDRARYQLLGHEGYHDNCSDNFRSVLAESGMDDGGPVPAPLNLFMNVPVTPDGRLRFEPPASAPGDRITFEALTDVVMVLSACPQDLVPVNGALLTPQDVEVESDETALAATRSRDLP